MYNSAKLLSLLFITIASFSMKGAEETYANVFQGSAIYNSIHTVTDPLYGSSGAFYTASVKNQVIFGINHSLVTASNTGILDVSIVLRITEEGGTPYQIALDVDYDFDAGYTKSQDKELYYFTGAQEVKVEVLSLNINGNNVVNGNQIPDILYLKNRIIVERYYNLNISVAPAYAAVGARGLDLTDDGLLNYQELEVFWSFIEGAEEYELEWTYVDNYEYDAVNDTVTFKSANEQDFFLSYFEGNSTSILTSQNFYRIPLVFDRGFILYRIRAIGRGGPGNDYSKILQGPWSTNSTSPSGTTGKVNFYHYFEIDGSLTPAHFPSINWQLNASYAEDGKKKEVLTYADGTYRSRQILTRSNTDNRVVIGETVYDHQGRPAVQVLPAPVVDPAGSQDNTKVFLGYKPAYNKSATDPSRGFSREDFDLDATACTTTPTALSNSSGAALYYSSNNGEKGGINAYIPDAGGFPYTRTQYTADNTGRVSRVSGLGPDGQLDANGKYTSYYYSQPFQSDLDKLFSCNIGYKSFYRKTLIVDPNGQVSVNYVDNTGKTVATALAGAPPTGLQPLKDESGNPLYSQTSTVPVDLLNKANTGDADTDTDDNIKVTSGTDNLLRFSSAIPVVAEGSGLDFTYSLTVDPFVNDCMGQTLAFQPVYDLHLSFKDECGEDIISGITNPQRVGTSDVQSGVLTLPAINLSSGGLKVGSYPVSKILKINEQALEDYTELYIQGADCILEPDDFFSPSDTTGCDITCAECAASIPPGLSSAERRKLLELCWEPCSYASPCEIAFKNMLADVSPYGQYAALEKNADGTIKDPLSLFNGNSKMIYHGATPAWQNPVFYSGGATKFYDEDLTTRSTIKVNNGIPANTAGITNGLVYPEQLTNAEDFTDNWKSSWAYSLVTYHPEWANYSLCNDLTSKRYVQYDSISSEDYDHMLNSTGTYAEAQAVSLYRSSNPGTLNLTATGTYSILDYDPFFRSGAPGNHLRSAILAEMQNFRGSGKNIYEFTSMSVSCGSWYGTDYQSNCASTASFGTGSNVDQQWETLKGLYLSLKQKYTGRYFDNGGSGSAWAISSCYSGCIGEESFNPFYKPSFIFANPPVLPFIWLNSQFFYPYQPCSFWKFALYLSKARRLYSEYPYYLNKYNEEEEDNAGGTVYQKTGMCPLAVDLKSLLQELAQADLLTELSSVHTQNMHHFGSYSKALYKALLIKKGESVPNGIEAFIATHTFRQFSLSLPANNASQVNLNFNLISSTATTTITGPVTNFFQDYKVVNIRRLVYTHKSGSTYHFKIEAEVQSISNPSVTYVEILNGTTFIPVGDCNFNNISQASKDMQQLKQLLNVLVLKETSSAPYLVNSSTGVALEGSSSPQTLLQTAFVQYPKPVLTGRSSGNWKWKKTGNNIFEIYDAAANASSLKMKIEFCAPPANGYSSITFFTDLKPNVDNCGCSSLAPNFQAKVRTVGAGPQYTESIEVLCGKIQILKGSSAAVAVSVGTVSPPGQGDDPCDTPEHTNFGFLRHIYLNHPNEVNSGDPVPAYVEPISATFPSPKIELEAQYYPVLQSLGYLLTDFMGNANSQVYVAEMENDHDAFAGQLCFRTLIPTGTTLDLSPDHPDPFPGGDPGDTTGGGGAQTMLHIKEGAFASQKLAWDFSSRGKGGPNAEESLKVLFGNYAVATSPDNPDYTWSTGCCIDYYMLDTVQGVYLDDMQYFDNFRIDKSLTGPDGKHHYFLVDGHYSSGTITFRGYSPCLALDECITCTPVTDPLISTTASIQSSWSDYQSLVSTHSTLNLTSYTLSDFSYYGFYQVYDSYEDYINYISAKYTGAAGTESYIIDIKDYHSNNLAFYLNNYKFLLTKIYANNSSTLPVDTAPDHITLLEFAGASLGSCFESYPSVTGTGPDPIQFAADCDPVFPCPQLPYVPFPQIDYFDDEEDPCITALSLIDSANAWQAYQDYLDKIRQQFRKNYIDHALGSVVEHFDMQATAQEYHFTLYYYDQAGNLVRTVPPKGVEVLNSTNVTSSKNNRNQDNDQDLTAHTMATTYRYNSLNQVTWQQTPDGGVSRFWYDPLGRLIISQNEKQAGNDDYSYTLYDALSRIIETAQVHNTTSIPATISSDKNAYSTWLGVNSSHPRTQVTRTFYDAAIHPSVEARFTNGQEHLRNRVSAVAYFPSYSSQATHYQHATHYSYDYHGNVKELIHHDVTFEMQPLFRKIKYKYDLVSGNINEVAYQPGKPDQFYHKYEYDAENRIKEVFTSRDGLFWEKDAKYFYYMHGPLARTELGDCQVQGMDYAYTLEGWIKGMNSSILKPETDPGADALSSSANPHHIFSKDMTGYSLRYHEGDYAPVKSMSAAQLFYPKTTGTQVQSQIPGLYNGNISFMATGISDNQENTAGIQGRGYIYDQLNRLINSRTYENIQSGSDKVAADNTFGNIPSQGTSSPYYTSYTYDANGNITGLIRKNQDGGAMDNLNYYYQNDDHGFAAGNNTNKLLSVWENVVNSGLSVDIPRHNSSFVPGSATANNYEYDEIGNLIRDDMECIEGIEWNVNGKIARIHYYDGSCPVTVNGETPVSSRPDLEFLYDAVGNRIVKIVKPRNGSGMVQSNLHWIYTIYVRDAQGNVMAVYERTFENGTYANTYITTVQLKESHIYGSSRLGLAAREEAHPEKADFAAVINQDGEFTQMQEGQGAFPPPPSSSLHARVLDRKTYELSNHLGNVLNVLSDRKVVKNYTEYTYTQTTLFEEYLPQTGILKFPDVNWDFEGDGYMDNQGEEGVFVEAEGESRLRTSFEKPAESPCYYWLCIEFSPEEWEGEVIHLQVLDEKEEVLFHFEISEPGRHCFKLEFDPGMGEQFFVDLLTEGYFRYHITDFEIYTDCGWIPSPPDVGGPITVLPNSEGTGLHVTAESESYITKNLAFDPGENCKYRVCVELELFEGSWPVVQFLDEGGDVLGEWEFEEGCVDITAESFGVIDVHYLRLFHHDAAEYFLYALTIEEICTTSVSDEYLVADVKSGQDYYPFGSALPGRTFNGGSYRYGFNGLEGDNEVKGNKNSYTSEFRQYDPRLGRWLSRDPIVHHGASSYNAFDNSPIVIIDPSGADGGDVNDKNQINATVYFENDGSMSDEEFNSYVDYAKQNIADVYSAEGLDPSTISYKILRASDNREEILSNQYNNILTVTAGNGTSHINPDRQTGLLFANERGNTAAHEFGHLFGLADRYVETAAAIPNSSLVDQRFTTPMTGIPDAGYNAGTNLYSGGGADLTSMQIDIMRDINANETNYNQGVVAVVNSRQLSSRISMTVDILNNNITLTMTNNKGKTEELKFIGRNSEGGFYGTGTYLLKQGTLKTRQNNLNILQTTFGH